jgi:ABC-2 type transport system ATP-binding protein
MNEFEIALTKVGIYFSRPRRTGEKDQGRPQKLSSEIDSKKQWALQDITFSAASGETIAILGRNGAGKTTLLRILEGSLLPDKGRFVSSTKPVSMNSLMSGFDGDTTVFRNLRILGRLRGISRGDLNEFAFEIIEFAGLVEKCNHPYKVLSTGMKARLGFSFAHIFQPEVLLIDEGLANGDRWFKEKSEKSLARYLASGKTIFMTGHSESLIRQTCSRGLILKQGKLLFDGPIQEAFETYHKMG